MSKAHLGEVRLKLLKHWTHSAGDQSWPGSRRDEIRQAGDDADGRLRPDRVEHITEKFQRATPQELGCLELWIGPAAGLVHMGMNIGVSKQRKNRNSLGLGHLGSRKLRTTETQTSLKLQTVSETSNGSRKPKMDLGNLKRK